MKVGIPKGLLYYKYHPFIETFLKELGAEVIISNDTNKEILNQGVKHCVDEACLPIKVFHGHVLDIKDKCDLVIIPRIMRIRDREFICPKFCGLPEMIKYSIDNMPEITQMPLYLNSEKELYKWFKSLGYKITKNLNLINKAFYKAKFAQQNFKSGIKDSGYKMRIALLGHPYNVYDEYTNMNIVEKLHKMDVGVLTEELVKNEEIDKEVNKLFKRPFWSFARNSYGAATYFSTKCKVDGIIYVSSFECGIDSVVIELIKNSIKDFPFLVLKLDEQTGQAGFNTRIEAFVDMLERRNIYDNNIPAHG